MKQMFLKPFLVTSVIILLIGCDTNPTEPKVDTGFKVVTNNPFVSSGKEGYDGIINFGFRGTLINNENNDEGVTVGFVFGRNPNITSTENYEWKIVLEPITEKGSSRFYKSFMLEGLDSGEYWLLAYGETSSGQVDGSKYYFHYENTGTEPPWM